MAVKFFTILFLAGLTVASAFDTRSTPSKCAGDNCDRALSGTGSNDGTARPILARSDCATFQTTTTFTTITPKPIRTVTTTTTITSFVVASTTTSQPKLKERDDTTKTVPVYASACSGSARFSSACACAFGSTASTKTSTITASPGTSTITVTKSKTTTLLTPSCTGSPPLPADQNCGCSNDVLFNSDISASADGLAVVDSFYSCGQICQSLTCCRAYLYKPFDGSGLGVGNCFIYTRSVTIGDGAFLAGRRRADSCAVPACNI